MSASKRLPSSDLPSIRKRTPAHERRRWGVVAATGLTAILVLSGCHAGPPVDGGSEPTESSGDSGQSDTEGYEASASNQEAVSAIAEADDVVAGLEFIESDHDRTVDEQIEITEIPSPPFKEDKRADDYLNRLEKAGVQDVAKDDEGNVYGMIKGAGEGPTLFVSAHLDTVFPEGTDVKVKEKDGILHAPGIQDDGRGLAALLSVARGFQESGVKPQGDIILGGTVGEEGEGDLRGVKAFFEDHDDIDGYISLDGDDPGAVTYQATGSHRFRISFPGPGGHSFGAFGTPSSVHAMGRAIAQISDLETPSEPKTTFTVGVVEGGSSVNAIAGDAAMLVDIRSNAEDEVVKVEEQIRSIVEEAAAAENERWDTNPDEGISVEVEMIGDRPAGTQDETSPIVETAWSSATSLGLEAALSGPSSTDSNLPISLDIPAVTIGGGGSGEGSHSLDESYDPTDAYQGPQRAFLAILSLVGVAEDGAPAPLLGS